MITPVEIQRKTFKSGIGYDRKEVDAFLKDVTSGYDKLYSENIELKGKLEALDDRIQYYKTVEETLQKTLVYAEKAAEDIRNAAREEAKNIQNEAKINANKILSDASYERDRIHLKSMELVRQFEQYKAQYKQILAVQTELISSDLCNLQFSGDHIEELLKESESESETFDSTELDQCIESEKVEPDPFMEKETINLDEIMPDSSIESEIIKLDQIEENQNIKSDQNIQQDAIVEDSEIELDSSIESESLGINQATQNETVKSNQTKEEKVIEPDQLIEQESLKLDPTIKNENTELEHPIETESEKPDSHMEVESVEAIRIQQNADMISKDFNEIESAVGEAACSIEQPSLELLKLEDLDSDGIRKLDVNQESISIMETKTEASPVETEGFSVTSTKTLTEEEEKETLAKMLKKITQSVGFNSGVKGFAKSKKEEELDMEAFEFIDTEKDMI